MGDNDDERTSIQVDDTQRKKEYKPSILEFEGQSFTHLSRLEWLSLVLSILPVVCAAALSFKTFAEEKPDSSQFTLAIVLVITMVFLLLVYQKHGVLMRMPYSLLLHCLFDMVVVAYCSVYYTLPNDDRKFKIAFLVLGTTAGVVDVLLALHLFRKYWQARTMTFPCGAKTLNQDESVKHLFTMCLLLLDLHLELTFVALVLKIDETGLATLEIVKLVVGVTYSTSMCVLGFVFLFQKWKPLVFVIPLASLAEFAYIIYNLVVTGLNWQGFPDEVIPAFIIAVTVANLAVRISVCGLLIYIYKHYRTEVVEMSKHSAYELGRIGKEEIETQNHEAGCREETFRENAVSLLSDGESGEQTTEVADDSPNLKRQSSSDLCTREKLFLVSSFIAFVCAVFLSVMMFIGVQRDSPKYILTIVVCITTVFLLVYPIHGVVMRMPYSLLLHCLCNVALLTYCRAYQTPMTIGFNPVKILMLVWGLFTMLNGLFLQYLFEKYRKTRARMFPCGAERNNQGVNVKHPFVTCLVLLDIYLELTFVVFVLKINETELTPSEIVKLVVGVIYSIILCVLGFLFLYKKWKLLVFVIPLASLAELAYIIFNLVVAGQTLASFPGKIIPALIIAVSIPCLAVRFTMCGFLIHIHKHIPTEVASCNKDRRYSYGAQLLGVCCTKCGQEWLEDGYLYPPDKDNTRPSVTVNGVVLKKQLKIITESNPAFQVKCSRTKLDNFNLQEVGDHVAWQRCCGYWHHAIVKQINRVRGCVEVIHWNKSDNNELKITQTWLELNQQQGQLFRIDYSDEIATANPSKLVLARARSRLNHTDYSLFHENCETFATYCKTGRAESCQVGWLFHRLITKLQTTVVKCSVKEIVKTLTAETVEISFGKSNAVGVGVLALMEICLCAYDLCKISRGSKAVVISRGDCKTSVCQRVAEAILAIVLAAGLGILGSLVPSGVGSFIGGIAGDFVGGVIGKFLGTCIGPAICHKLACC